MMHVTIYWGKKVTLLFHWWKTRTWMSYLITLLACFLFSAIHQYMEVRRIRFKYSTSSNSSTITVPLLSKFGHCRRFFHPAQLATSLLFGAHSAMGYLLMLAIMSCNGGVILAIVLGLSFGYLVFRSHGDQ
ncbi:copper transporter 5-like [Juglans regia]|uniref:Copper transport protein n=1 Tax=Juglans regia TaxID=51240 RepID=A0A6P9EJX8_JUGRE|nr:copper transporter 5-like [Juglans regia]